MKRGYSIKNLKRKKFSLVLSGGSTYGFAHIGVLEFLEENSLVPDEIIGTSAGSLIGGFLALGKSVKEIEEIIDDFDFEKLFDVSRMTKYSKELRKLKQVLRKEFEGIKINDLKIDLKVVVTNLSDGRVRVFSKKDNVLVYDAILASISVPGVLSRVKIGRNSYTDGGVSSNLPLEFAKKKNVLIASNVVNSSVKFRKIQSPFRIFSPFVARANVLIMSFHYLVLSQTENKLKNFKDVILIEPNLSGFRRFSFNRYKKMVQRGHFAARRAFKTL